MRQVYYVKGRSRPKRKISRVFWILGLLLITIYFTIDILTAKSLPKDVLGQQVVGTTDEIPPYPTLSPLSPTPATAAVSLPLEQVIQNALDGTHGSYGVVVKNLRTGENYSLNEHVIYYSASLYKLWVMAEAYRQIKTGSLKEDEILSQKYETLNTRFDIDPETAEFKTGTITLTVTDALSKMITISDNYAALLLTLRLKLANVVSFLKINGFNESAVTTNGANPTTTASDISLFFEKLYNKQLVGEQYSNKMLELLKAQKLNDKIPKYLPFDVFAAHKTGELDEYTHDAGIVYVQNDDYIIVILSKSDDPDLAKERISNISESVYNYFTNNQEQAPLTP